MQLYLADVPFDDAGTTKYRPALIIVPGRDTSRIFKVTSRFNSKSATIQAVYFPLQDWQAAGLKRPSWVDCHRLYNIATAQLVRRRLIGQLSDADTARLFRFVKDHRAAIQHVQNRD
nr:type II toxin-antitoxin system PemK/MazF family toxin [Lacticaseibacillus parakribbianus]